MPYRILAGEDIASALRRIAREQVDRAIDSIEEEGRHEAIHDVRKRCKKVRGLLRLVHGSFDDYSEENAWFRDEARTLSALRDATSHIECSAALAERFGDEMESVAKLLDALESRRTSLYTDLEAGDRLDAVRAHLDEARERIAAWSLEDDGFDALADGIERTYERARKALRRVHEDPSTENLHEWRKRVKYHRYHLRLLRGIWPPFMGPWRDAAKLLSDRLGDDHDLAMLRRLVVAEPDAVVPVPRELLLGLIDCRRKELQAWALPVGERLFTESRRAVRRRLARSWHAWGVEQQLTSALGEHTREVA